MSRMDLALLPEGAVIVGWHPIYGDGDRNGVAAVRKRRMVDGELFWEVTGWEGLHTTYEFERAIRFGRTEVVYLPESARSALSEGGTT